MRCGEFAVYEAKPTVYALNALKHAERISQKKAIYGKTQITQLCAIICGAR
jgi:hypothetical protein